MKSNNIVKNLSQYCQGTTSPPLSQSVCCGVSKTSESSSAHCLCNPPAVRLKFNFPFKRVNVSYVISTETDHV